MTVLFQPVADFPVEHLTFEEVLHLTGNVVADTGAACPSKI